MTAAAIDLLTERRLQGLPEPDLSVVEITLLAYADHDDRDKRRHHTFVCSPFEMLKCMEHWQDKYPERLGYYGWQYFPTQRNVGKCFDDRLYDAAGVAPWWLERLGAKENTSFAQTFRTSAALTNALEALGSSSTWLAGYESATYDNTSNNDLDVWMAGTVITSGTVNSTAATRGEIWLVTETADGTWPDVFDGTTSAETITSQGVKDGFLKSLAFINCDAVTQGRPYPWGKVSTAQALGGFAPSKFVLFTTHNFGTALHASAAGVTHSKGVYITGT